MCWGFGVRWHGFGDLLIFVIIMIIVPVSCISVVSGVAFGGVFEP